jgi:hypothetical protein
MLYLKPLQLIALGIALICCTKANGQSRDSLHRPITQKYLCLIVGVAHNEGWGGEIGVSKMSVGAVGPHPFSSGLAVSSEFYFGPKLLVVPKLSAWSAGGMGGLAMGLNLADYTDFSQSSLVFRPEIGFGMDFFKLTYGYNIKITNTAFDRVKHDVLSVSVNFKLHKRK